MRLRCLVLHQPLRRCPALSAHLHRSPRRTSACCACARASARSACTVGQGVYYANCTAVRAAGAAPATDPLLRVRDDHLGTARTWPVSCREQKGDAGRGLRCGRHLTVGEVSDIVEHDTGIGPEASRCGSAAPSLLAVGVWP